MKGWKMKLNRIEEGMERGSLVLSEWKNGMDDGTEYWSHGVIFLFLLYFLR